MKTRTLLPLLVLVAAVPASAAEINKANNTTALNSAGSWVSGGPPGTGDVAVWSATVTAANSSVLGGSMTWSGIKVTNPGGNVTIGATSGATLSLGAGGIDVSSSDRNLTINTALTPIANQGWNVTSSNRSLTVAAQTGGAGVTITRTGDGTLNFNNTAVSSSFAANLALNGGTTRFVNASGAQTFSGSISGIGTLARTGNGTLVLSGNNAGYTGAFNITSAGPVHLGNPNALGSGTVTFNATAGAFLDNVSGAPLTLGGTPSLVISNPLTFVGTDDLDLGAAAVTLNNTPTITVTGGKLSSAGAIGAGSGGLTKAGAGFLDIRTGAEATLAGNLAINDGMVELNGGRLTLAAITGTTAGSLVWNGGTLRPRADAGSFIAGIADVWVGADGAVIDTDGYVATLAKPLRHDSLLGEGEDGGLLVRDGLDTGRITLAGANTYTGPTVIESGTLAMGAGASITASPRIEVQTEGSFDAGTGFTLADGQTLTGDGEVDGKLTVGAGATLAPGGVLPSALKANDTVTLNGTVEIRIQKTGSLLSHDAVRNLAKVNYGGTLSVTQSGNSLGGGDSFTLFDALEYSGEFTTIDLPPLAVGLLWDTSQLAVNGTISVIDTLPDPVVSPLGGNYFFPPTVTITGMAGSTIRYTLDGSNPGISATAISAPSPVTGIQVPDSPVPFTIRAYATMPPVSPSAEVTAVYQMQGAAVWTANTDGNWQDTANWQDGVVANGSGAPANFGTLALTGNRTVSLIAPAAVGILKFGDVGNAFGWTIAGTDALTLDTNDGVPTVEVVNQSATLATPLGGSQGLIKTGAGLLVLSGANTYTGATAINAGTLQLGDGTNQPSVNSNYTIAGNTTLRIRYNAAAGSQAQTWSKFTGAGTLALTTGKSNDSGWGSMTLPTTFTGKVVIEGGRVQNNSTGTTFGNASLVSVRPGGQLALYNAPGGSTVTANLEIAGTGFGEVDYPGALRLPDASATLAGAIALTGDAAICGSWSGSAVGTITATISGGPDADLSIVNPEWNPNYTFVLSGANTYSGNTTVEVGVLRLGAPDVIPNGPGKGILTVSSVLTASVNLYGFNETINGLSGTGPVTSTLAGALLSVGDADLSSSYGGELKGSLSLRKIGAGILTLTGNSSNTGTTTVNAGTLVVNGSLGAGSVVTVNSGATLAGGGTAAGEVTANSGSSLAPGADAAATGVLTTGSLALAGTYQCQLSGATADRLTVNGNLTLAGSTLAVSTLGATNAGVRVIASYSGVRSGTFGGTLPPGYSVSYDDTAKEVRLTVPGGSDPYGTWASSKGLTAANNGKAQDPDGDGVSNLLEYYLGGEPLTASSTILPKVVAMNATTVTFGFSRLDEAEAAFPVQNFQYGSSLSGWTPVAIGSGSSSAPGGIVVTVTENATAPDSVTVAIPRALATGAKIFGRLELNEQAP
ncbi:MAG: autotransporter-associated beta strand repeat-containing protein [Verrucomicrobia bacterium]|nr:autotransporter-associated beta strand repeat-containing protein [Verrucomicrobiota bacterium]